jgi:hypothetical protein
VLAAHPEAGKPGLYRGRVALLNADKLNVGVSVFIAVRTNQHNAEWAQALQEDRDQLFRKSWISFG